MNWTGIANFIAQMIAWRLCFYVIAQAAKRLPPTKRLINRYYRWLNRILNRIEKYLYERKRAQLIKARPEVEYLIILGEEFGKYGPYKHTPC